MSKSRSNSRKICSPKLDLAPPLPWSTDCFGQNHGGHREHKKKKRSSLCSSGFHPYFSTQALDATLKRCADKCGWGQSQTPLSELAFNTVFRVVFALLAFHN